MCVCIFITQISPTIFVVAIETLVIFRNKPTRTLFHPYKQVMTLLFFSCLSHEKRNHRDEIKITHYKKKNESCEIFFLLLFISKILNLNLPIFFFSRNIFLFTIIYLCLFLIKKSFFSFSNSIIFFFQNLFTQIF